MHVVMLASTLRSSPGWLPAPFRLNNSRTPALQLTNVTIMLDPVELQVRA